MHYSYTVLTQSLENVNGQRFPCACVCVLVSGLFFDLGPYGYSAKLSLHFKGHLCRTPAGQSINHTHSCIFTVLFLILSYAPFLVTGGLLSSYPDSDSAFICASDFSQQRVIIVHDFEMSMWIAEK